MKRTVIVICAMIALTGLLCPAESQAQYTVTANIIDLYQKCTITGMVQDSLGNGVYPAKVTFTCGNIKTEVDTLPGGAFINDPPPCNDYTITATTPDSKTASQSGVSVAENELLPLDLTIASEPSLAEAVSALRILTGLETEAVPGDHDQNNRVGLQDAVYCLEVLAGLRQGPIVQSLKTSRFTLSTTTAVQISRDNDGDGVDDWFRQTVTDAYGYVVIDGLSDGDYTLTAFSADNSSAVRFEKIKVAGRNVNLKTLRLKPVGSISGKVELEGETDHSGTRVSIPGTSHDASTDSQGNFVISNVPEGTYDLRAEKQGFATLWINEVPVETGIDFALEPSKLPAVVGSVSGSVWLQGAADYSGILVTLRKDAGTTYVTVTDAGGGYAFADVAIGAYTLEAAMAGFVAQKSPFNVQSGANLPSPMNLLINNSKGTLSGTVSLDNITDYSGILVSLAGTGHLATTDAAGAFTISSIPEGAYSAFVKAEGYGAQRIENIQILSNQPTTLSPIELTASSGTPNATIVGQALYLGETLHSGIVITVEPNPTGIPAAATDTKGGFIIKNVPAGTYTLSFANFPDYKTVVRRGVVVPPWNTTFIRPVVMIPPEGSVRGTIVVEGTAPGDDVYTDVDVYANYAPEGTSTTTHPSREKNGGFVLENVREGIVTIIAVKPGYNSASTPNVHVLAGQTSIIEAPMVLKTPPQPPTGIVASQASGSSVTVSWTASVSTDVAGYNIYYGTQSSQIDQKANTTLVDGTSYEVTGLNKGTTYYFAAEAVDNDALVSQPSQYDSAEIVPRVPVYPDYSEIMEGQYPFISPEAICIGRDGRYAYVTNPYNNVVSLIDLQTKAVLGTIVVGNFPGDIAANPVRDEVYCVNKNSNTVTVIDSTRADPSEAVTGTYNTGASPNRCLVSPDGKYLFISCIHATAESITVIDLDTGSEIAASPIAVGTDPQGMAIAGNRLYVASETENKVDVIDIAPESPTRWQMIGSPIPVGGSPVDVAASSNGLYIYVANSNSDSISVINTANHQVSSLNVGDYPIRLAVSGNMLYVTNFLGQNVSMINTDSNQVLSTTFGVGQYPQGIAIDADGETLYIVNNLSESVSIRNY